MQNSQKPSGKILHMEATTWSRDSHDLFDYEASPYFTTSLVINPPCKILRSGTDVYCQSDEIKENIQGSTDHLLSIRPALMSNFINFAAKYEVHPAEKLALPQGLTSKKLWLIVRYLPSKKHVIQENDIIKLGRCKLKVKQLITASQGHVSLRYDEFPCIEAPNTLSEMSNAQCRICLMEGGTPEDPLIQACACRGTIEYIHVSCLKRWITDKLSFSSDQSKSCYCLKLVRCELCRQSFPIVVKKGNGESIQLFHTPEEVLTPPLIVLENLIGVSPRSYHIISIRNQIKLGRGHDCDVRISDVSISRHHATLSYENDKFTIEDHNSKFGTLVSVKHPLPIKESEDLAFQAGRTVLTLQLLDTDKSDQNKLTNYRDSIIKMMRGENSASCEQ